MMDFALMVVAVAFAVLVGYLVPTIIQLKKTVSQSERLLARLNQELPPLLKELRSASEQVNLITAQAKEGVDRVSVLLNAIGEVGQTIHQVHGVVRGRGMSMIMSATSVLAAMKAAASTLTHRVHRKGEKHHGK